FPQGRDRLQITDPIVHAEIDVAGGNAGELEAIRDADRHAVGDVARERDVRALAALDEYAGCQPAIGEDPQAAGVPRGPQPRLREVGARIVRGAEKFVGIAGYVFGHVLEPDQTPDRASVELLREQVA